MSIRSEKWCVAKQPAVESIELAQWLPKGMQVNLECSVVWGACVDGFKSVNLMDVICFPDSL